MDLQARIDAEQALIANDQMQLQGLAMMQDAERRLAEQRDREARAAMYRQTMDDYRAGFQ
jgi:type IV secretion system protein VirB5